MKNKQFDELWSTNKKNDWSLTFDYNFQYDFNMARSYWDTCAAVYDNQSFLPNLTMVKDPKVQYCDLDLNVLSVSKSWQGTCSQKFHQAKVYKLMWS